MKIKVLLAIAIALLVGTPKAKADSYTYTSSGSYYNVLTPTCNDVYGRVFRGCTYINWKDNTTGTSGSQWQLSAGFASSAGQYARSEEVVSNGVASFPNTWACSPWSQPKNLVFTLHKNGVLWNGQGAILPTDLVEHIETFKGGCGGSGSSHTAVISGLNTPTASGVVCPQVIGSGQTTLGQSFAIQITLDGQTVCK